MGERTPVAIHDGPASARLAIAEAITNIAAADVAQLRDIRLSANWMAAAGYGNDDYSLYEMVRAVGEELCPALGLAIPVGKDSLSMRTVWQDVGGEPQAVTAPVSLIVSAFAPVADVRRTLTPELAREPGLGARADRPRERQDAARRLVPRADVRSLRRRAARSRRSVAAHRVLRGAARASRIGARARVSRPLRRRAIHDARRDGVRGTRRARRRARRRCARSRRLSFRRGARARWCRSNGRISRASSAVLAKHSLAHAVVAGVAAHGDVAIRRAGTELYRAPRVELQRKWSELTFRMQALRDDPECAREAFESALDAADPGLDARGSRSSCRRSGAPGRAPAGPKSRCCVSRA